MKSPKKDKKKNAKIVLISFFITILIVAIAFGLVFKDKKEKEKEITYDQLYQDIIDQKVEKIEMTVGSATVKVKYKISNSFFKKKKIHKKEQYSARKSSTKLFFKRDIRSISACLR